MENCLESFIFPRCMFLHKKKWILEARGLLFHFQVFHSKGTALIKFTLVAFTSRVSERSFWIYIQNTRVSTDFMSNIRKTKFWKWYFLLKIETIVLYISIISVFLYPTEKYGWGLNDVLSKWSYRNCLIINWMPKLFLMQW